MPVISMFYGLIVSMFYLDTKQHKLPHIHVRYSGKDAVFEIPEGRILEGVLPYRERKVDKGMDRDTQGGINGQLGVGSNRK